MGFTALSSQTTIILCKMLPSDNLEFPHCCSVPNAYKSDPDIQHLPVFAVTTKFFNSVWSTYHKRVMTFDPIARFLVGYQHILFYPVMALAR